MSVSGVTELTNIIPEIWSQEFYQNLKKNLPMANFFSRDYEGEIRQFGDIVNINEFSNPTAEELTDDKQQFATEAVSITKHQLQADRRFSVAYEITDLADLQSLSFQEEIRNNMVYALAKKVEDYVESLISPSTSAPDHVITTASANVLALADVEGMRALLSAQGVAMADRALFCDTQFYSDLLGDSSVASRDFTPGGPVVTGQIGFPVLGFEVMEANNITTAYKAYAAHKSAIALAMQQDVRIKISDQHPNRKYGYIISADLVMGAKQLSDVRVVTITGS